MVTEFISVIAERCDKQGLLISTSGFSNSAVEALTEVDRRTVNLGDRGTVVKLCRTYMRIANGLLLPSDYEGIIDSVKIDI